MYDSFRWSQALGNVNIEAASSGAAIGSAVPCLRRFRIIELSGESLPQPVSDRHISSLHIFMIFLRLGITSLGGPVAHIGYFRQEFVESMYFLQTSLSNSAHKGFKSSRTVSQTLSRSISK